MKRYVLVLTIICSVLLCGVNVMASSSGKVGYYDMQVIIEQSKYAKDAKAQLDKEKTRLQAELEEKAKPFKTAREEFDKKKSVMDENARNKKTKELQEMGAEIEKSAMESEQSLKKLYSDLIGPFSDKVKEIVRRIGRDEKYDLILESGAGNIITYGNESLDLSHRIVQELEKTPPVRK